jgi:hypothetical protein
MDMSQIVSIGKHHSAQHSVRSNMGQAHNALMEELLELRKKVAK